MAEPEVTRAVGQFQERLLRGDREVAAVLTRAYGDAWLRMRAEVDDLLTKYNQALQTGQPISPSWLYEQNRLQDLQRQVEAEMARLAQFTEEQIIAGQQAAVAQAPRDAQLAFDLAMQDFEIRAVFNLLPKEALADLVGFLQNGAPLRNLLDTLGPEVSRGMADALIQGLALGQGPREIAALMRRELGMGLARALRISRTEVLRSYREATYRNYQANSGVVKGWVWLAAKSDRTCAACLALDGTFHELDERLESHPNCRCAMAPETKSWQELGIQGVAETATPYQTGAEWFAGQSEATQRAILGNAAFEAYQSGVVQLQDFVGVKYSPVWGAGRYTRSLKEIIG